MAKVVVYERKPHPRHVQTRDGKDVVITNKQELPKGVWLTLGEVIQPKKKGKKNAKSN